MPAELDRASDKYIAEIVRGSVRLAPLIYNDVRIVVGLLLLVCLLDKPTELEEVRVVDLRQVIGDRKAVIPGQDRIAVSRVQIASSPGKDTYRNIRIAVLEKADPLQP